MSSSVGIISSDGEKKTCSKPPTSMVTIGSISQVTWDWSVIESGNSLQSGPQVADTWANEDRISANPHVVPVKNQPQLWPWLPVITGDFHGIIQSINGVTC